MELDTSLPAAKVVRVLDLLTHDLATPKTVVLDNGPEFFSQALDAGAYQNQVALEFSRPGKSTDNAFAESFNGHCREECLD